MQFNYQDGYISLVVCSGLTMDDGQHNH